MYLLADSQLLSLLPLLVMVPVTVWLMRRVYRRQAPREKTAPSTRSQARQQRLQSSGTLGEHSPAQVSQWEVQMHETTRELSAKLDNKMQALNRFIDLADAASARMERLLAEVHAQQDDQMANRDAVSKPS